MKTNIIVYSLMCTLLLCNFIYLNTMNKKINSVVRYVNNKRQEKLAEQELFEYNKKRLEDVSFNRVAIVE